MSGALLKFVIISIAVVAACGGSDDTGLVGNAGSGGKDGSTGGVGGTGATSGGTTATDASDDTAAESGVTGGVGGDGQAGGGGDAGCSTTFHADADQDGFGDPNAQKIACVAPRGYVDNGDDCYDGNAAANPTQTMWFTVDRGDGSFDYDCDGVETQKAAAIGSCSIGICAVLQQGWQGSVPACGEKHAWITACTGLAICAPQTESRTQECQ